MLRPTTHAISLPILCLPLLAPNTNPALADLYTRLLLAPLARHALPPPILSSTSPAQPHLAPLALPNPLHLLDLTHSTSLCARLHPLPPSSPPTLTTQALSACRMASSQIAYNKTRPSNLKACLDELAPSATTTGQPVARQKWDTYKSGHLGCLTGHEVLVFKGKHEEDAMSFTPDIALLLVAGATVTAIDASELESLKSWTSWFGGRDWQGKAFWLIWREAEWELVCSVCCLRLACDAS